MHNWLLFLALTVVAAPALAWWDECGNVREMSDSAPLSGASRIEIDARAGTLEVSGVDGATTLEVATVACATRKEMIEQIRWGIDRDGATLRVWVELPQTDDDEYARLDLDIRVPAGIDVDIEDSSGSMRVERVGALRVRDTSGSITIADTTGPVILRDSSGSIELRNARGPVDIEDSSGSIDVRNIGAGVRISDGSGSIQVAEVDGSVDIVRDGSGSISVADVRGDFIVRRDGSGSITHRRVAGVVDLPRDR